MFERMHELFGILNARRRRRGSIDFDLPEAEVMLDEAGLVEAIVAAERNIAHRIIEEFMLLANETVAELSRQAACPASTACTKSRTRSRSSSSTSSSAGFGYSLARAARAPFDRGTSSGCSSGFMARPRSGRLPS